MFLSKCKDKADRFIFKVSFLRSFLWKNIYMWDTKDKGGKGKQEKMKEKKKEMKS